MLCWKNTASKRVCVCVCAHSVVSDSLWLLLYLARLLCLWNFLSKNIGAGCHFFSKASSQPRDWTHIFCISCTGRHVLYHLNQQLVLKGMCVCVCVRLLSHVWCIAIPWTVAHQAPLSMRFSSQEYWSGLPFPTPEDLLEPGIETVSPCLLHWQVCALPLSHLGSPLREI